MESSEIPQRNPRPWIESPPRPSLPHFSFSRARSRKPDDWSNPSLGQVEADRHSVIGSVDRAGEALKGRDSDERNQNQQQCVFRQILSRFFFPQTLEQTFHFDPPAVDRHSPSELGA